MFAEPFFGSSKIVTTASKSIGLRYWMLRVLEECDNVATDFRADPVHDLRVSLRRCRSLADGMKAMDPDREWKAMKKAGKKLFQSLGSLRDVQIMMEWIDKLHVAREDVERESLAESTSPVSRESEANFIVPVDPARGPESAQDPAATLLHILKARESEQKQLARVALEEFDRKQWRQWAKSLPIRATRIRPGSAVFKHLALERWTAARALHTRALRNRSQVGFHSLRIGIKRFRYIVENFLPEEHKLWGDDLKHLQDLLGEVHDLDVLWAAAISYHIFPDEDSKQTWHKRVNKERAKRIEEYCQKTTGPDSLWNAWRSSLPQGRRIHEFATRRMKLWAKILDPDFAHSERVARLALELYDGLAAAGLFPETFHNGAGTETRDSLYAAALLHDVGKVKGNKGHHKESLELIKQHGTPLGWNAETLARAATVARFHCGALPTRSHRHLRDLLPSEQKVIIRLAAILRLANALDAYHDGRIRKIKIENSAGLAAHRRRGKNGFLRKPPVLGKNEALVIGAEGYADGTPTAQAVAAERYLLETVLRRPVVVRGLRSEAAR
jgi:CHAD domain-containing protein/HD superfamily phosphodiesterase